VGLTMNQKNPPTRSSRLAAIVTMTATSLPNTEVDGRSLTTASYEAIANAPDRTDERRMFGVVPQLLAHPADEHVDRSVERLRIDAAHGFHDAIACHDTPAVSDEQAQQLELGGRQRERSPLEGGRLGRPVHLQGTHADDVIGLRCAAAQHRLHARDELTRLERFREVIVGAQLEPKDPVGNIATSGQHDDWDAA